MRVLIMADMEGVAGIVHWDQVTNGTAMYQEGRRLYTEEVNAAVRGAKAGGATEIVVVDSHGAGAAGTMAGPAFNSLIPELMDPDAEFVTHHGWANYTAMLESGCDACFFVGIHARGGTLNGTLSHTISSSHWLDIAINDVLVGEIGVVAALCGHFGVPMVLVTGDDHACAEARGLLGEGPVTVQVKEGLGRTSARNLAPARARKMIEEGARRALENVGACRPLRFESPVAVRFEIAQANHMEAYLGMDGVEIERPRTVISRGADFWEAWRRVAPYR